MFDTGNRSRSAAVPAGCADGAPPVALAALIVEDSNHDVELVLAALQKAGYLPVRWRQVEDAVGMEIALAEETWDVVVSEHRMAFDAFKALAVLDASGADVPLIVVSGAIGEKTAAAFCAGAADFVSKDRFHRLGGAVVRCLREPAEHRRVASDPKVM